VSFNVVSRADSGKPVLGKSSAHLRMVIPAKAPGPTILPRISQHNGGQNPPKVGRGDGSLRFVIIEAGMATMKRKMPFEPADADLTVFRPASIDKRRA
jgi:hypothetical protein